jgi:hypothetical protein
MLSSGHGRGRKRTLLIAASILVSRQRAQLEGKPSPALDAAIADAIALAARIMQKIDNCWSLPDAGGSMYDLIGGLSVEGANLEEARHRDGYTAR